MFNLYNENMELQATGSYSSLILYAKVELIQFYSITGA